VGCLSFTAFSLAITVGLLRIKCYKIALKVDFVSFTAFPKAIYLGKCSIEPHYKAYYRESTCDKKNISRPITVSCLSFTACPCELTYKWPKTVGCATFTAFPLAHWVDLPDGLSPRLFKLYCIPLGSHCR
jgi:hypothetical protein